MAAAAAWEPLRLPPATQEDEDEVRSQQEDEFPDHMSLSMRMSDSDEESQLDGAQHSESSTESKTVRLSRPRDYLVRDLHVQNTTRSVPLQTSSEQRPLSGAHHAASDTESVTVRLPGPRRRFDRQGVRPLVVHNLVRQAAPYIDLVSSTDNSLARTGSSSSVRSHVTIETRGDAEAPVMPSLPAAAAAAAAVPAVKTEDEPPRISLVEGKRIREIAESELEKHRRTVREQSRNTAAAAVREDPVERKRRAGEAASREDQVQQRKYIDQRRRLVEEGVDKKVVSALDESEAKRRLQVLYSRYASGDEVSVMEAVASGGKIQYDSVDAQLARGKALGVLKATGVGKTLLRRDREHWQKAYGPEGAFMRAFARVTHAANAESVRDFQRVEEARRQREEAEAGRQRPEREARERAEAEERQKAELRRQQVANAALARSKEEHASRAALLNSDSSSAVGHQRLTKARIDSLLSVRRGDEQIPSGFSFMQPVVYNPASSFVNKPSILMELKLDGNRALWDGYRQVLYSHAFVMVIPPNQWSAHMPRDCVLDGELYMPSPLQVNGTKTEFASSLSAVSAVWARKKEGGGRSSLSTDAFMKIQFHAFDILGETVCSLPLGARKAILQALAHRFTLDTSTNPIFRVSNWVQLEGATPELRQQEIDAQLAHYAALGAEGLVLKNMESVYKFNAGKTTEWQKAKVFEDIEAKVVEKYPARPPRYPKGVNVLLPDGQRVTVVFASSNLISDDSKIAVGDIVRVAYMPDAGRPGAKGLRTPIIRAVIRGGKPWAEIVRTEAEKRRRAQAVQLPAAAAAAAAAPREQIEIEGNALCERIEKWSM